MSYCSDPESGWYYVNLLPIPASAIATDEALDTQGDVLLRHFARAQYDQITQRLDEMRTRAQPRNLSSCLLRSIATTNSLFQRSPAPMAAPEVLLQHRRSLDHTFYAALLEFVIVIVLCVTAPPELAVAHGYQRLYRKRTIETRSGSTVFSIIPFLLRQSKS